jgi:hypothetical protein
MTLSQAEERILDRGLRALAGGAVSGALTARLFKPNVAERDLALASTLDMATERARDAVAEEGTVLMDRRTVEGTHVVQGAVGAGKWNMNPAAVTVTIEADGDRTQLRIRGVAREGLIKQRAGEEAAERVSARLAQS